MASILVENSKPVHQQIKGGLGSGKTSLLNKTLRIVPERYIKKLANDSGKSFDDLFLQLKKDANWLELSNTN